MMFRARIHTIVAGLESWIPKYIKLSGEQLVSKGGRLILTSSLLVAGLVTGAKQFGLFEPAELFFFDSWTQVMSDLPPDPEIVIVGMTEADIQQYGWPLTDDWLAAALAKLQTAEPSVVGLDIYRSSFRPPGEVEFAAQLAQDNLIAIMHAGSDPNLGEVPPPPVVPHERVSFNDLPIDQDGILRRNLMFVDGHQQGYYSFALRVLLKHLENTGTADPILIVEPEKLMINGHAFPRLEAHAGGYQKADARGYQIMVRYRNRYTPAEQLSISQVLSHNFDPEQVHGKIVLVGTSASSLKDQFYTPYSSNQRQEFTMPGVVIHAQILAQMLDVVEGQHALYWFLPHEAEIVWLLLWCLAAGGMAWWIKRPVVLLTCSGLLLLGIGGLGGVALTRLLWLPMAEPMVGAIATLGTVMAHKLLYRTTYDALTGLHNREAFLANLGNTFKSQLNRGHSGKEHSGKEYSGQDKLSQELGGQGKNGTTDETLPNFVAFMDIDRFKVINESLGHHAGDQVLQRVTHRLNQWLPPKAHLARVGGDEFAVSLHGMSRETAGKLLDNLQAHLAAPFEIDGQKFSTTVSMGVAVTQPGYDHKPADLLRDAHTAMYRAKSLGKARYEVFSAGMLVEAVNRLKLESDLISALEKKEFLLYYQPITCLKTGKIAGFEALVRWQQEERGFVMPGAFIPIAEETGLIMSLGQWIFQEACQQLAEWRQKFPQLPNLTMSINLSNRQFGQTDLVQQVANVLRETPVSGEYIRLEITESMVMGDVEAAIDLMLRLKSLNLKLGIDDFGTGYSSLSYLHRFPMDTLKVDKSFVGRMETSLEDREIVHTIIALGHKLGMEIVAEGIEAQEHIDLLRNMGCEYGQGYFFARPLPRTAAEELLQRHSVGSSSTDNADKTYTSREVT